VGKALFILAILAFPMIGFADEINVKDKRIIAFSSEEKSDEELELDQKLVKTRANFVCRNLGYRRALSFQVFETKGSGYAHDDVDFTQAIETISESSFHTFFSTIDCTQTKRTKRRSLASSADGSMRRESSAALEHVEFSAKSLLDSMNDLEEERKAKKKKQVSLKKECFDSRNTSVHPFSHHLRLTRKQKAVRKLHSLSWALKDSLRREMLERMAEITDEDIVFYRWGSPYEYDRVGNRRAFHIDTVNHSDAAKSAGRGFYVSESPTESAEYGIEKKGEYGLVTVTVKRGARFLDLTRPDVQARLKKMGLTNKDVFRLDPEVMVRYTEAYREKSKTFWVLKTHEGVSISKFDGDHLTFEEIEQFEGEMDARYRDEQELKGHRDYFSRVVKEVKRKKKKEKDDSCGASSSEAMKI
jgi:hypothetical protein